MIHVLLDNFQIYVIFFNSKLGLSWLKYFLKKQSSPLTPVEKCSLHYHPLYTTCKDKGPLCSPSLRATPLYARGQPGGGGHQQTGATSSL